MNKFLRNIIYLHFLQINHRHFDKNMQQVNNQRSLKYITQPFYFIIHWGYKFWRVVFCVFKLIIFNIIYIENIFFLFIYQTVQVCNRNYFFNRVLIFIIFYFSPDLLHIYFYIILSQYLINSISYFILRIKPKIYLMTFFYCNFSLEEVLYYFFFNFSLIINIFNDFLMIKNYLKKDH